MTFGRRLIWLSILALLMQLGLGIAWLATAGGLAPEQVLALTE